jgi:twitching motility protein PilU
LQLLSAEGGSDLYLSTGAPPCAKFQGQLKPIDSQIMQPGEIKQIACEIMDNTQQAEFEQELEMNLAISVSGYGRFRINIFVQRNEVGIVARNIVADIPQWQDLRLPAILPEVIMRKRGLVLFVGATGSGKSTSLAALIDYRNSNSSGHIVTIEDPVEYVHSHKKSIVNQREVGVDTRSWHNALKNTLRQAPDVILIGEIRDRETMEHAIAFAETGHLCISTLHANNANQALDRIINFFPEERRQQLLMDLIAGNPDGGRPGASWRDRRYQGSHAEIRKYRHEDLRHRPVRAVPGGPDHRGRGPAQCGFPQQRSIEDQVCP